MSRVRLVVFTALLTALPLSLFAQKVPTYRKADAPIEERVNDLLKKMSLEEKVAQMESTWQDPTFLKEPELFLVKGKVDEEKAAALLKDGLGEVSRPSTGLDATQMAHTTNIIQKIFVEKTRLGIPTIFHEECLHGAALIGGTSYPQAIGLAATFDPALARRIFDATAAEVRARGAQECLMPVVDLARDPRWGRTEETYGEDPYLAGRMGVAAVEGLQGTGAAFDGHHVMATLKHFAVHSQPEGGTNVGPANYSERTVREYFLPPFEAGIQKAHARAVMPSYNELDGIPNHSNTWLLRTVLRQEMGFTGLIVSDYFAIDEMIRVHHVAADCAEAARFALNAGVDIELPFAKCYKELPALVRSKEVPEQLIDEAVRRILRQKFELGLFEHPYVEESAAASVSDTPEHRALALQAARETLTLLKNDDHLLPLDASRIHRIAVIGPNAGEAHLGGYSGTPTHAVSVLQGIKDYLGSRVEVVYAQGCAITESKPVWETDEAVAADPAKDEQRMTDAVQALNSADVGLVVVGENEQTSREAWSPTHMGDRDNLDLLGRQDELVRRLLATGKPVVVLLLHGRPNSINFIAANAKAILDGWYLGQEGGTAVAQVLFGEFNPAGRLPITVPRSVGQLPVYYYAKPSAKRGYLFASTEPLYPFGFGLSYTTFKYANLKLSQTSIAPGASATVSVDVTNTGERDGDEVVQMYVHRTLASVTQPVKLLKGFERISLKRGETRTVTFTVGPEELRFYDREMRRVVEPGPVEILVGPDSAHLSAAKLTISGSRP